MQDICRMDVLETNKNLIGEEFAVDNDQNVNNQTISSLRTHACFQASRASI